MIWELIVCLISSTYRAGRDLYYWAIHYITECKSVMYIHIHTICSHYTYNVVCLHVYIRKCSSWPKWPQCTHTLHTHALLIDISESFTIGHQSDAHEFYLAFLDSIEGRLDLKCVMTNTMYVYFILMAVNCRGQDVMKSNLAMTLHSQSTSSS